MTEVTSTTDLRLERTFDAPRERVFDAWTNPEVLRRWWAAGPDYEGVAAEVDLRVGGSLRLTMRAPDGQTHTGGGEYLEIDEPNRLVYSWRWEDGEGTVSNVAVDFIEADRGTTVVLNHTGLPTENSRDQHVHGWKECLDNLGRRVLEA
jgi:uncharacterized protein YndB with AHSA1/START domain